MFWSIRMFSFRSIPSSMMVSLLVEDFWSHNIVYISARIPAYISACISAYIWHYIFDYIMDHIPRAKSKLSKPLGLKFNTKIILYPIVYFLFVSYYNWLYILLCLFTKIWASTYPSQHYVMLTPWRVGVHSFLYPGRHFESSN